MFLRTTSTTRPLTVIWCFSVFILILHYFKNLIRQGIIWQDVANCIADFSLLDLATTPTILFGSLDFSIHLDGELLIFAKVIVERPLGRGIQRFWIGCPASWVLHLPGKFNDASQILLVFSCLILTLLDQGIE